MPPRSSLLLSPLCQLAGFASLSYEQLKGRFDWWGLLLAVQVSSVLPPRQGSFP